ncbi:hypothetical protein SLA2020_122610 [Shorea laevis]
MGASKRSTLFCMISLLMFFFHPSLAITSLPASVELICSSSQYPSFCKSYLPQDKPHTRQDHRRISLNQSLSSAHNLLSLVQNYLSQPSTSTLVAIRALEDCQLLAH